MRRHLGAKIFVVRTLDRFDGETLIARIHTNFFKEGNEEMAGSFVMVDRELPGEVAS